MTKEELGLELASLIHLSGLNVTITVTIRDGDATFARMLSAGANPPGPANPFNPDELRKLINRPPPLDMGTQLV